MLRRSPPAPGKAGPGRLPRRLFDWFFRDRRTGRIVIAQWPNWSLTLFGVAALAELASGSQGLVGAATHLLASACLVIWAADELLRGVNPWRRYLGAAVLIGLVLRLTIWN